MSVIGNRFTHANRCGLSFLPQAVNSATVNGATILHPWRYGRAITFILVGDSPATTDLTCIVQGQRASDDVWEPITGLTFTPAKLNDGGQMDGGCLLGELDVGALDGVTYKAIRLSFTNSAATAALIGGSYSIFDLYDHPSGDIDDLWETQRAL